MQAEKEFNMDESLSKLKALTAKRKAEAKRTRVEQNVTNRGPDWTGSFERAVIGTEHLFQAYEWPVERHLEALKKRGGNPYFEFWQDYWGCYDRWAFKHIAPAFARAPSKLIRAWPDVFTTPTGGLETAAHLASSLARQYAVAYFSWAVPDNYAISAISSLRVPVIDYGAGRGYWAWVLRQHGVTVEPYEPGTYEFYWADPLKRVPDGWRRRYAAMFCWPSYGDPWATRRLAAYKGDTVIYIGEGEGGCTADDSFHRLLERCYERDSVVDIPQWWGLNDYMAIYKR
jgi:hypothetical protein